MKIFIFEREVYGWDEVDSVVIKAENIEKAKEVAKEYNWEAEYDENYVIIKEIDLNDNKNEVIFESVNEG